MWILPGEIFITRLFKTYSWWVTYMRKMIKKWKNWGLKNEKHDVYIRNVLGKILDKGQLQCDTAGNLSCQKPAHKLHVCVCVCEGGTCTKPNSKNTKSSSCFMLVTDFYTSCTMLQTK